jgi:cytochrome P450
MKDAVGDDDQLRRRPRGRDPPPVAPHRQEPQVRAARALVHRSIDEIIASRRRTDESQWPDDLLTRLMKVRDEQTGQAMSEGLLRDESITTFFAGHETTATHHDLRLVRARREPGRR